MKQRYKIKTAAYLLLIKDNKILLSLREGTGYMDGLYGLPSGHLEANETIADACVRETLEEINIVLKKEDLKLATTMFRKGKDEGDDYIDFFFICDRYEGELKNNEPNKCGSLEFFDIENLPQNTIEYVRKAIHNSNNDIHHYEC
ncbi:MAG TPA: NUDIX domain-containing protein [Rickettsiales bacterium]|nr:NUDIX domain-containing protein [Rickettsiales bacterium]